ncbi:MAG: hypothetical protein KIT84_00815 [Labilithrix sp.]|nr:hypothetical protein [Labilithrix sp.]MCW5809525.1 hypothetical protein [Labilithrix sp.]
MRSNLIVSSVLAVSAVVAFANGCSTEVGDGDVAADEGAATAAEISQARAAVSLLTGANGKCNRCHTASKADVLRWGAKMQAIESECIKPVGLTREQRIACLKGPDGFYEATHLGLYSAGTKTAQFKQLFITGEGGAAEQEAYDEFALGAGMPIGNVPPFSEAEFTRIKRWVLAGMPALDVALEDPDLGPCRPSTTPELRAHIQKMATDGWGARLADAATPMFGCGEGAGEQCLTQFPDVTAQWSAPDADQVLRKLRDVPFKSHWWIRSSPDGKYAGFGLNNAGKFIDLSKPAPGGIIDVKASYDPQFFPNNEGFSFAGVGSGNGPIKVCRMSVLTGATGPITMNETGCSTIISSVYQTVGAALDNHLYLMTTGAHVNDDGEASGTGPRPGFDGSAKTIFTPMVSDGVKFVPQRNVTVELPYEGDQALSPSNAYLVTRFGNKTGGRGLRIRKLNVTETVTPGSSGGASTTTYGVTTEVLGTVCTNAAKGAVSYDERFVVSHEYVDKNETPELPAKSANVILVDLFTGKTVRLTHMKDRQYAFAPHFRADGWIYWDVRDMAAGTETLVASDAAIRMMAETPTLPQGATH